MVCICSTWMYKRVVHTHVCIYEQTCAHIRRTCVLVVKSIGVTSCTHECHTCRATRTAAAAVVVSLVGLDR